jgi:hypothetical protein
MGVNQDSNSTNGEFKMIKQQKNGFIKVTAWNKRITVVLGPSDIQQAIRELIENEEQKLEKWENYKSDIIEDLKFALKYGVQELDLDHPVALLIVRFAANNVCENPF